MTAENWGTTHSVVIKWQLLPPSNDYGILAGYRVRYRLTAIGEESVEDDSEEEMVTSPGTNQVLLENLVMYGTYGVWVSAFTVTGDGPASFTYAGQLSCFLIFFFSFQFSIDLMHDDVTRPEGSMGVVVTLKSKMAARSASTCSRRNSKILV